MMVGTPSADSTSNIQGAKTTKKRKKQIIVGLKSQDCGRDMLLRLLKFNVSPGDCVLAVHVQMAVDTFDPNRFHSHEDLCKSKQVCELELIV